jgi:hypothetical protein
MVKNTKGGSGHKSQARKYNKPTTNTRVRMSEDPSEIYAVIIKRLGGEFCHVKCTDGQTRLCVIRGKFRGGGGKKDNFINLNTWVLVGLRDWETVKENTDKLQKCDLLEVYNENDKMKLKTIPNIRWSELHTEQTNPSSSSSSNPDEDFIFADNSNEEDYKKYMESLARKQTNAMTLQPIKEANTSSDEDEDEIDIDAI